MAHHSATTNDAGPSPLAPHRLQELWAVLNARYFNGALSPIRISWSRRLTASAGMFVTRVGPHARRHNVTDTGTERRLIRLSLPLLLDQPEREIVVTLAHEMIHQWQFERLKRRPNHGPDFHHMMEAMNRNGLGITINHALDDAVQALMKYEWRCRQCGQQYRRQRRTIRPGRHRCGTCRGKLDEVVPAQTRSQKVRSEDRQSHDFAPLLGSVQLKFDFSMS
jgi:predicted SprT family Zn-dependent metalloprotease